ncbi:unnamed protein product [Heligmosomoides polygyrus]|uniref:MULE domain-containing protein n=1 Tax=Heligmosomoides polygyrus TaxID=6339 RepID=A0A183G4J9_HELPZ|nr:unnamed protein product [Heligmosomoides polygyrus]
MLERLKKYLSKGVTLEYTFHTTRYNVKLRTLMVADKRDRRLPAEVLLSGIMATSDTEKLFLEMCKLVPEFSPKTLVTDEAPCFNIGFCAVFPDVPTRHAVTMFTYKAIGSEVQTLKESASRPWMTPTPEMEMKLASTVANQVELL